MDAGAERGGDSSDLELRLESACNATCLAGRQAGTGLGMCPARRRTAGAPTRVRDVPPLDSRV